MAAGALSVEEAAKLLELHAVRQLEGLARLDTARSLRRRVPEIVHSEGKPVEEAIKLAVALFDASTRAILSGATEAHRQLFSQLRPEAHITLDAKARMMVAKGAGFRPPSPGGTVGIVTAGTSDIPVARQAQVILEETGCTVHTFWDVGIAGLHRLFPVVREIIERDCDVVVVVAGQEGALAPVLAGLLDVPVIGLPTSTGSGYGGQGHSALMTMLQACSLGIAVVNIDNGVAAGAVAAAIARRARRKPSKKLPTRIPG